jgi:hypothetical protein
MSVDAKAPREALFFFLLCLASHRLVSSPPPNGTSRSSKPPDFISAAIDHLPPKGQRFLTISKRSRRPEQLKKIPPKAPVRSWVPSVHPLEFHPNVKE